MIYSPMGAAFLAEADRAAINTVFGLKSAVADSG